MSRLWPDIQWCGLTRVLVLADQVLAEHWPAGIQSERVIRQAALSGSDAASLQSAVISLLNQLSVTRWQRIELYLADRHVHFLRLPAVADARHRAGLSGEEQMAYARAMLMQTYGEAARHWPFRPQEVRQPQDCLLAAIPALHGINIGSWLAQHCLQYSIQPYVSALWARSRLPKDGTVVTGESHMMRLLQLKQGQVAYVSGLAGRVTDTQKVIAWLLRERMLLGAQDTRCYWLAEPGCQAMAQLGRSLAQASISQLSWETLYSGQAVTTLWSEVTHAA